MRVGSKVFVVDADVTAKCSERNPTGSGCRDVLNTIRVVCHRVALADDITAEWARHQCPWFRGWLASMFAKRKQHPVAPLPSGLGDRLSSLAMGERELRDMQRDLHLVEIALAAHGIVVSCDKQGRALFAIASQHLAELRDILWLNPDECTERTLQWVRDGAEACSDYQLPAYPLDQH